ncbi:MAG: diguanylate cyclase (GGDEF)-like protein, partial [Gammaproteobacteria bacterium]
MGSRRSAGKVAIERMATRLSLEFATNTTTSAPAARHNTIRLLLIEDNRGDYLLTREMLTDIGSWRFSLDWESTFDGGLEALSTGTYDVCLVDYTIGGHNGAELLEQAQRRANETPLVMLTGMVNPEIDELAMALGAADYLVKNEVTPAILDRAIRHAIERARLLAELAQLAKHDALTGLANRTLLRDFLSGAMARTRRSTQLMAVLLLDLDHFKHVNDQLGHEFGDQLLVHVAQCLTASVRLGDLVARLGGDEFVIVLDNIATREDAGRVANKVVEQLSTTTLLRGHEIQIGASIGIACYEDGDEDPTELLKAADTAMYEAKGDGRGGFRFFAPKMQEKALARATLEADFVRGIEAGELELHFQPQVAGASANIVGLEALVRWRRGGALWPPDEFIPMAEEANLIQRLDQWVLKQACRQSGIWRLQGLLDSTQIVAVNISAQQLTDARFPAFVAAVLEEAGIDANSLEIELTESTMLRDPELAIESLYALAQMGVRLAIDDFGTGYSSLSYLKRLPVHTLKIDRSFTDDINVNPVNDAIIASTIGLAHTLNLNIVAEG